MTTAPSPGTTAEHDRLNQATEWAEDSLAEANPWYEWGPYLSERAWGTVREDYSDSGDAWSFFPHDHARSRAYRWNEDGMAGLSDIGHELCLALALWNGVDPILKERMFGLTGQQGNHGEDVKDYWWFLDGLPSHAWLRWRYHRLHRPAQAATSPDGQWYGSYFDDVMADRKRETDEFYAALAPDDIGTEEMRVLRQACAGLVWSKQMYPYRVAQWLEGDPDQPPPPHGHRFGRNSGWRHFDSFDVLAMPDPWEYPWFAAWDLAFHAVSWAHLDPAFAKYQLLVLLREWYLHPNGALPAYEWSFDDVNPPVHALAALRVFVIGGATDLEFLERVFQKLLLNFTWWLNRQDPEGNNIFGGGFLGLDNISPIDRSHLPAGARLDQADGTAWMAYYSVAMLTMAAILAQRDSVYEDMVVKFLEQLVLVMDALEESGCYDPDDGFFYDLLTDAFGNRAPVKVQTLVGVIPTLPAITLPTRNTERLQRLRKRFARKLEAENRQILDWRIRGTGNSRRALVSIVSPDQLRRIFATLFDENAFLSPHGLRALSKRHSTPYQVPGMPSATIKYEPAESSTAMYGGNSNWRGPVWFPINYLVIRALLQYDQFFGPEFTIEYPTGSGQHLALGDIAGDLVGR